MTSDQHKPFQFFLKGLKIIIGLGVVIVIVYLIALFETCCHDLKTTPTSTSTFTITPSESPIASTPIASMTPTITITVMPSPSPTHTPTPTTTPTNTPTIIETTSLVPTPICPTPIGWISYTIQSGDTLSYLASQTNSSVSEIIQGNCLSDTVIVINATLSLPSHPPSRTPTSTPTQTFTPIPISTPHSGHQAADTPTPAPLPLP